MKYTADSPMSLYKKTLEVNTYLLQQVRNQYAKQLDDEIQKPIMEKKRDDIEAVLLAKEKSREYKSKEQWFANKKIERSTVPQNHQSFYQKKQTIKEIMKKGGFRNSFDFMLENFGDLDWLIPGDTRSDAEVVHQKKCRIIYDFKTKMHSFKKYYSDIETDDEVWAIIENKFRGKYWELQRKASRRVDRKSNK